MLSQIELESAQRGDGWKRFLRAAAALNGIYNDADLADAVEVTPGAVRGWWGGARPKADTIDDLARAVGLSRDDLSRWINYDGPPPRLPAIEDEAQERADAAERSLRARSADEASEAPRAPPRVNGIGGLSESRVSGTMDLRSSAFSRRSAWPSPLTSSRSSTEPYAVDVSSPMSRACGQTAELSTKWGSS